MSKEADGILKEWMLPIEEIAKSVPVLLATNVWVEPDWPFKLKTATPQFSEPGAQSGSRVCPG
ncbi:MAG: hypothetical protein A3D52_02545 [Candidatus Taylorbacteria bacterium RIFCSPHIGHO2_02_FULL_44_36]|uniref:Uncharacterized protein n=1 Tax=Candidatus Taylorbacteria bacterium RIFCSPLOWO2_12_FULL_44_15c TaxID=1802333 RepID=A0A1G2P514_9BACT|nr:MAG: hypothetical protein A3D52_02545 [Candidatus Taylorbacteria bacterium RIFCSPHIGHO2_02_FULL_44_36]OHA38044.1 MAG: hypothetical protein A3I97_03050 [Candidatus Taylorbacteria bacterium RIFCSPLOWO2_02_FULL_44_35]OHA43428.1 MAG: hypothetical protein A3G03_01270 [Candidatus Taylorbacteria bacterium RIFCSPLOWO2_12_FULL_44_15c]